MDAKIERGLVGPSRELALCKRTLLKFCPAICDTLGGCGLAGSRLDGSSLVCLNVFNLGSFDLPRVVLKGVGPELTGVRNKG
eukprot:3840969-Amphidinium_carterae.1